MKSRAEKVQFASLRRIRAMHEARSQLDAIETTLTGNPNFDTLHSLDRFTAAAKELRAALSDEFLQLSLLADAERSK